MVPKDYSWTIPGPNNAILCPYVEHTIIRQENATETGPSVNCIPSTTTANTLAGKLQSDGLQVGNANNSFQETFTFMMANTSGSATIYFYNFNSPVRFEIYQGNTLIKSTADAAALSTSDKTFLSTNAYAAILFSSEVVDLDRTFTLNGNNYATGAGKIAVSHNPTNGRTYSVVVKKGAGASEWRYLAEYPINANTVDCTLPPMRIS